MEEKKLLATRDGWGDGLFELGKTDERVVVLTADLKESTRVERFANAYPDRFIECGVAEQNMMGIAAGLAAAGKIPFVSSYAVFSPGRNWDQLRVSVAYSNLPVIVGGHHSGFSAGPDGATHQALEDIAITRVLPNMTVVVPSDYWEAKKATQAAVDVGGAVYIRLGKQETRQITTEDAGFSIGKAEIVWDSENLKFEIINLKSNSNDKLLNSPKNEAVIIGCGPILIECLAAARQLHEEGIGTVVINNHTIKPIDKETILRMARKYNAVVTVEEHQKAGGMGSAVAELLVSNHQVPMELVGVANSFGESGTIDELTEKYDLKAKYIIRAVKRVIERKE